MKITAVVMAYNRREYLAEAVSSALRQVPQSEGPHEILVAKNFPDDFVYGTERVRIIDNSGKTSGETLIQAAEEARGDVLAFLDDDDAWEPGKIAAVDRAFSYRPEIAYFGHSHSTMDVTGTRNGTNRFVVRRERRLGQLPKTLRPLSSQAELRDASSLNAGNDSSIAIRRECLLDVADHIRRTTASIDVALYWAAVVSGRPVMYDPRRLTRVRVGSANYSRPGLSSYAGYIAAYRRMQEGHAVSFRAIRDMVRERAGEWAAEPLEDKLREIEHFLAVANASIRREEAVRGTMGRLPMNLRMSYLAAAVHPELARALNYVNAMVRWG